MCYNNVCWLFLTIFLQDGSMIWTVGNVSENQVTPQPNNGTYRLIDTSQDRNLSRIVSILNKLGLT